MRDVSERILTSSTFMGGLFLALLAISVVSPDLAWLAVHRPPENAVQEILLPGIATVGVLLSLSPRLWIGTLLLVPWAIIAPLEAYYVLDFGKSVDSHLLGIIADSNFSEASSFLSGTAALFFAIALIFILVAATALFLSFRLRLRWTGRSRYWVLLASLFVLVLPELMKFHGPVRALPIEAAQAAGRSPGSALADDGFPELFDYLEQVYPAGVPSRVYAYVQQRRALREAQEMLSGFSFQASQEGPVDVRQVYLLVIGETGRPDHLQLNGYDRETTPRLLSQERLLSFRNAFSPWAWTRMSVPIILTRKPGEDNNQFFPERSLVSAFREAGFRTYWFSTQSPLGPHDSSIALHAAEADETRYLNVADYKTEGVFDGALLSPVDQVLKRGESKVLIVLHTLGGHFNYADRYPETFEKFLPSLKGMANAGLHNREIRREFNNSYDNSLLYFDYFMSSLISRLEKERVVSSMFYIADHGENLYDGTCEKAGHGRGNDYDFRVPALFWYSRGYEELFPEKLKAIASRVDSPISTTNVFHSILDGANIHYPGERLESSVFSKNWKPSPRITQNKIDFDLADREGDCKRLVAKSPETN